jgi:hypothetical protein
MEYRSKVEFLGLPLVHVRLRGPGDIGMRPPAAKGWIAVGDMAFGVLFAAGGFACGGISLGGASVGLLAFGGGSAGFMALGGLAIGWWALGGLAIGVEAALGGLAIAGKVALGGLAIAGQAAAGGQAIAPQIGGEAVKAFFDHHPFFHWGQLVLRHSRWLILLPVLLPLVLFWRKLAPGDSSSST